MKWTEIRQTYPERQWLVLEVLACHQQGNRDVLDEVTVVETCPDSSAAFQSYRRLRSQYPGCEFVFMCTDREDLALEVLTWRGRRPHSDR